MGKTQKYLAEALGTFALVGIGSFAIVSFQVGGQSLRRGGDRLDRTRLRPRAPDRAVRIR